MPGISRAVCGILWCLTGAVVAEVASERPWPPWLPHVDIEDYECRKELPNPVVNWADLRQRFGDLVKQLLDERTLSPLSPLSPETRMTRIQSLQMELLEFAAVILWRFPVALNECPFGAVTASIFATCMAFMDQTELSNSPLKSPYDRFLNDLAQQSFLELVSRDLAVLLDLANLHVTAASEWATFALLHIYLPKIRGVKYSDPDQLKCAGVSVAGYKSERILEMLRRHIPYASGRDIEGLKFLRGLDPIVSATMKDPREFSTSFVQACPAGAAAFASASAMLALMSNPSLFERFSNLARWILRSYPTEALMGATTWTLFHAVAKLGNFALRSFDLVWSPDQLLNLPQDPHDFDRLRLDPALRVKHLEAAEGHQHPATRELASFLRNIKGIQQDPESMVYITAVGGVPFANYIQGFIQRALKVGLSALVIACMDSIALERCSQVVQDVKRSGSGSERFLCVPAMEGHVIFIKHAFLPVLLSAAVDTVWIDFDTFILQDPSPALRATRENPREVLPRRSRVRFGSFLFQNASDICNLSKICDKRQYMEVNVTSSMEESPLDYQGVELLVTEHWDARCLNNGLFYVRASYRTLIFFNLFLRQIYINPYTDNQNLFDAFLSHSTLDTAVPDARPLLRYALLDIDRQFGCAEGHASASATEDGLVTFHFWASDFRTREAAETEKGVSPASAGRIVARDGVERVEKVRAKKDELFEIFFSEAAQEEYSRGLLGIPSAGADFIAQVRAPQPNWRGMCSVTAVGVEDLVDERLLQGENQLIDWKAATNVMGADMSEVEREAAKDGDCEAKPRCEGIPLDEWALALQAIAQLGEADGEGLSVAEVVVLKQRIRTLDVGTLLTVRAFNRYGPSRLAKELKELLEAEG